MKVRFELNIDEIVEVLQFPNTRDEIFKGEDAKDKTFLFVDKLTGDKQAVCCLEPSSDTKECARLNIFFMPFGSHIINDEVKSDTTHGEMMARIEEVSANACKAVQEHITKASSCLEDFLVEQMDKLKEEGIGGSGISEKTLLSALSIVTKQNK